mgnify:FL=1
MKKSAVVVGAVAVVAAAYTGAAWYVGVQAEKHIEAAVARANDRIVQTLGPDLNTLSAKIEIRDYERGLFSTRARYTFVVQDGEEQFEFALRDHMHHGPFPWDLVKNGTFSPMLAHSHSQLEDTSTVRRWFDASRGAMPLEVDTRIAFGGSGASVWQFAPLEWLVEDESLKFSGGRAEVTFRNEFSESEGQGEFASLIMGSDGQTIILKDIRLESRTSSSPEKIVEVQSKVQAANVSFADDTGEIVSADRVSASFESKQNGPVMDAKLHYDLQSVRMGEIDLGNVSLGGQLNSFNYEAFTALLTEYDAIAAGHGAEDGEEFDLTPEDEARLLKAVKPVLATSPLVAVGPVTWRNDRGESILSVQAQFQPLAGATPEEQADALMEALKELKLDVVISRPMILQAIAQMDPAAGDPAQLQMFAAMMFDQYVGQLEKEGLVRREDDRALSTIIFRSGGVDVNGEIMSVEDFMGRYGGFLLF